MELARWKIFVKLISSTDGKLIFGMKGDMKN